MSWKIHELRELPDEEVISAHDSAAVNTSWGVRDYLEELRRREASRREDLMIRLTWAIFGLTVVNVLAVVAALFLD